MSRGSGVSPSFGGRGRVSPRRLYTSAEFLYRLDCFTVNGTHMISWLKGRIEEVDGYTAVVDVHGVGYEVWCSRRARERLVPGEEASLVVYTDVKEDSIRLFGFDDRLEKQVFLLLLKVKGVGSRTAGEVISQIDKTDLLRTIGSGDLTTLQSLRGIGKKTAERIILELKDLVTQFAVEHHSVSASRVDGSPKGGGAWEEATLALRALGFSQREAERCVTEVFSQHEGTGATSPATGEIVKEALRYV
jgi:holliday junction DNA helicase RuvA